MADYLNKHISEQKEILRIRSLCGTWSHKKTASRIKIRESTTAPDALFIKIYYSHKLLWDSNIPYSEVLSWAELNLVGFIQTVVEYPECSDLLQSAPKTLLESAKELSKKVSEDKPKTSDNSFDLFKE